MNPEEQIEQAGQQYYSAGQFDKAYESIQALYALGRTDSRLRIFEANCLYHMLCAWDAVEIMRSLLAQDSTNHDLRILLAQYLMTVGEFEKSYELLQTISPATPSYHTFMGWHLARRGDFLGGWKEFASEPGFIQMAYRLLPQEKQFKKGMELRNKRILFALEGGFGDEVLFSRFVPQLEAQGAKVIMGASPRIKELMQMNKWVADARELASISQNEYDYYLPAVEVIDLLEITDPQKNCDFPYLFPDPGQVARWKPILDQEAAGKIKIGIHWQGNWGFDTLEMKSPPAHLMAKFAPLGRLFSLQRDAGGNTLPPGTLVFGTEAGAPSWASTAAVVSEMDYIVTNDTSTAHLAGALGKKTLVLLLHAPHIYWIANEHESVFYPTVRTFRQPKYNDWEGAVENAIDFLKKDMLADTKHT